MIDRATIDRIMDATNIVDVVSDFVTLRKAGVNYKGLCPFHDDKTPSFMVSPSKQICHCFACGEGGNVVNFLMKHEQITYPEALRWLAKKYNIEIQEKELTDRQLNKLKQMITTTNVDVRAPFGRHKEKRVRVATYAASGNKEEFLTDQTGNRRWLPFHVTAIDSPYVHSLPYDGMFAQARYLLENNFNYWFDLEEIKSLEGHVEEFMIPTSEEELVPIYFSPAKLGDAGSTFLTLAEISAKIVAFGCLKKNPEPRRLGAIMTKLGFKKERMGHGGRRGYYVFEHTQSEIDRMRHPEIF